MGIVIAPAYALTLTAAGINWMPIIGWQNLVISSGVVAISETTNEPATNIANPSTNLIWKSAVLTEQFVTSTFTTGAEIDYVGVARHNFGSNAIGVTIEGLPIGGNPATDWAVLVATQLLADDSPALFRFAPTYVDAIRLRLAASSVVPQAGILFSGALLALSCGVPPGHVPITYGRTTQKLAPRAQNGDYLGQVLMTGGLNSNIEQRNIDPAWYRTNLEPFRAASPGQTFFWAWDPQDYPSEVGYCWVTNDPIPTISQQTGEINITFDIGGIAV